MKQLDEQNRYLLVSPIMSNKRVCVLQNRWGPLVVVRMTRHS